MENNCFVVCRCLTLSLLGIIGCGIIGCSGSTKEETNVVDPPNLGGTDGADAEKPVPTLTPPGTMELPEDFDPNAVDEGAGEESNQQPSFQMPDSPAEVSKSSLRKINVQFANWDDIKSVPTQTGKITVLDLWSLSCEPCMKEIPGLVKLHRRLGDQVHCVAANLDFDGRKRRPPEYYQPRVEAFLEGVGAHGMPTYICSTPNDQVYADAAIASLPAVMIYDRQGQAIQKFVDAGETSGFTYEKDVIPVVEKLASSK